MTARIIRRRKAAEDAEEIADYLAKTSLEAAVRLIRATVIEMSVLAPQQQFGSAVSVPVDDR
jgi:plasmid stabilization system protein ParE